MTLTFTLAVLGLLLTPGPTNTLMALAGAEGGFRRALRLIPAELAGYLAIVLPLAWVGAAWMAHVPAVRPVIAALAAVWVMVLAVRMWRLPVSDGAEGKTVTGARVLLTTMLNPKALIFGLVLLPPQDGLAVRTAGFAALVVLVAMVWTGFGAVLRRPGSAGLSPVIRRLAAGWLALLSALLAAKAMGA